MEFLKYHSSSAINMSHRRGASAACVMLCLVLVTASSNIINSRMLFGKNHLIISKESLKTTSLLFGMCDLSDNDRSNGSCRVVRETFNSEGTGHLTADICFVELKMRLTSDVNLAQVGENKAVLVALDDSMEHSDEQRVHLINVDLGSCKKNYVQVEAPPSKHNWTYTDVFAVPYESTYDLVFFHSDGSAGTNYKGTYDLEGKVVKAIAPWTELEATEDFVQFTNTKYHSDDGGFIVLRSGSEKLVASFIDANGKKVLKEWNLPAGTYSTQLFFDNDAAVTACVLIQKNPKVQCLVYGSKGEEKHEVALDVVPYYVQAVDDGFVVLHGKCIDLTKTPEDANLSCEDSKVYVRRLNAQGQLVKELPLDTFPLLPDPEKYAAHVFKNDAGEICVSYMSFSNSIRSYLTHENSFKISKQCFADL